MIDYKSTTLSILPALARGLLRSRHLRTLATDVVAGTKVAAGRIPAISLHDLEGIPDTRVLSALEDGAVIAIIARSIGAREVFEFGTYLGWTAQLVAEQNPECQVTTLDLPEGMSFGEAVADSANQVSDARLVSVPVRGHRIAGEPATRITQIRCESSKFDETPYRGRFDLIYIDASHTYSAVTNDTLKALTMIRPGGVIIWDDYNYPGVWRWLNELAAQQPDRRFRYIRQWGKVIMLGDGQKLVGDPR